MIETNFTIREDDEGIPHIVQRMEYDHTRGKVTFFFFDGTIHYQPVDFIMPDYDGREPEDEDYEHMAVSGALWWLETMPEVNERRERGEL